MQGEIYDIERDLVLTFGKLVSQEFTNKDLSVVPLSELRDENLLHVDFAKDHEPKHLPCRTESQLSCEVTWAATWD